MKKIIITSIKKITRIFASILFFVMSLFFLLGIISWFVIPAVVGDIPLNRELPLSEIEGIAVDSNGRIYLHSQVYNRVQVYDKNGKFIKGWLIDLGRKGHKSVRMTIDEQDHLSVHIINAGGDYDIYLFDFYDNLLKKDTMAADGDHDIFEESKELKYIDRFQYRDKANNIYYLDEINHHHVYAVNSKGDYYAMNESSIFPEIYKIDISGNKSLLISIPFYLWLIMMPLPAWFFVFGFLLIMYIFQEAKKIINKAKYQKNSKIN